MSGHKLILLLHAETHFGGLAYYTGRHAFALHAEGGLRNSAPRSLLYTRGIEGTVASCYRAWSITEWNFVGLRECALVAVSLLYIVLTCTAIAVLPAVDASDAASDRNAPVPIAR